MNRMSSPRASRGSPKAERSPGTTGRSKLAMGATLGAKSKEKEVKFKNQSTGRVLTGTLVQGSKKQTVILCHGFASSRNSFHFPAIAKQLAQHDVSSLRFDFSGNGDSEGQFEYGNYAVEALDIRAAVQYVRDGGSKVIGLVGHSKGAGSVLLYSSQHDDIPNVVNVAGRFDMCTGVKERFGEDIIERLASEKQIAMTNQRDDGSKLEWNLTKWSLQDRLDLNMAAVSSKICLSDVLTIHGTQDTVIPVEDASKWQQHIKSHQLHLIEGGDHNFKQAKHAKDMIDAVVRHCCH